MGALASTASRKSLTSRCCCGVARSATPVPLRLTVCQEYISVPLLLQFIARLHPLRIIMVDRLRKRVSE